MGDYQISQADLDEIFTDRLGKDMASCSADESGCYVSIRNQLWMSPKTSVQIVEEVLELLGVEVIDDET